MKKLFLLSAILLLSLNLFSQTSITVETRHFCIYQFENQEFTDCDETEEPSIFVFNESETLFTHTTPGIKSTYYILDTDHDSDNGVFMYETVSDVGNEYIFIIDLKESIIVALYMNDYKEGDLNTLSVIWEIKSVF